MVYVKICDRMTHFCTYESSIVVCCVTVCGSVRPAVCALSENIGVCGKITQHTISKYVLQVAWVCAYLLEQAAGNFAVCCQANSQNCGKRVLASSCRSAWNTWAPIGRIFVKFRILSIFRKSVEKIQVSLKSDKNVGYCTVLVLVLVLVLYCT